MISSSQDDRTEQCVLSTLAQDVLKVDMWAMFSYMIPIYQVWYVKLYRMYNICQCVRYLLYYFMFIIVWHHEMFRPSISTLNVLRLIRVCFVAVYCLLFYKTTKLVYSGNVLMSINWCLYINSSWSFSHHQWVSLVAFCFHFEITFRCIGIYVLHFYCFHVNCRV